MRPVPRARASALAPLTSSSDIRSWPTRVTQPVTRPPGGNAVEHGGLALQHLGGGRGERTVLDVPTPRPDRAPHADRGHAGRDPCRMGHRAGLDRRRDAVGDRLDAGEGGGELVVVAGVRGVHGHGPGEDRLAGGQVVGDRRADQAVAGQVLVGVDEARRDDRARRRRAWARRDGDGRPPPRSTTPTDRPVGHEDGGVDQDRARAASIVSTWSPAHDEVGGRDRGRGRRRLVVAVGGTVVGSNGQTVRPSAGTANLRACPGPSCSATTRPCSGTGTPSPAAPTWPASRSAVTLLGARLRGLAGRRRRRRRRARPLPPPRGAAVARAAARRRPGVRVPRLALRPRRSLRPRAVRRRRGAGAAQGPPRRPSMPPSATASSGSAPVSRRPASRRSPTTPTRAIAGSTWTSSAGRPRPPA